MTWHRVGLSILALVLVVGVTLTLVWQAWGMQWFTAHAITFAKERLGRDLSIAHVAISWSLKPTIVATDITLGNSSWSSRPEMLHVGRAQIEVDLPSLLSGLVQIDHVRLDNVDLLLEIDKSGERNWHFRFHKPLWQRIEALPPVDLRKVRVDGMRIAFRDGRRGIVHSATVQQFTAHAGEAGALHFQFTGTVEHEWLSGQGVVGSLLLLRDPNDPYPVETSVVTHNERARIAGKLQKPLKDLQLDLAASMSGSELAVAAKKLGVDMPPLGPFNVSATVVGPVLKPALRSIKASVRRSGLEFALHGDVGDLKASDDIDVNGTVRITDRKLLHRLFLNLPPPVVLTAEGRFVRKGDIYRAENITLHAGRTVLRGETQLTLTGPRPRVTSTITGKFDFSGSPTRHSVAKVWDKRLPVELLRQLDAEVNINLHEVTVAGAPAAHQVRAQVSLMDGHVLIAPISLRIPPEDSEIAARLILDADRYGAVSASMQFVAASLSLSKFLDAIGEPHGIEGGLTTVDVDVTTKGTRLREHFANMNGEARVTVGETQLVGRKLDFGADVLTRLLTLAMPFTKSEDTVVHCAAVRLPIVDGVITIDRSAAIETKKVTIVASGVINLQDNSIQLFTRTRAATGLGMGGGVLTDVVQVQGTLDQPRIGISDERALRAGLSVGAAVATGGFTWIAGGLFNRFSSDQHPCSTALADKQ